MKRWLPLLPSLCLAAAAAAEPARVAYASRPVFTLEPTPINHSLPPPPKISIWCEFEPYESVRAHLPALAERQMELFLHVSPSDIGDPQLLALLREAETLGVEVMAWLLLPYDEHLYVGEWTLAPTRRFALAYADWVRSEGLKQRWIIFDCEPAPLLGKNMYEQVRRLSVRGLAGYLREQKDAARFAESVRALNALIGDLHTRGFLVLGAGNRIILDGLRYNNHTWQDALNVPFSMIRWDRVSFITYRYHASRRYYLAMIKRYATLAVRHFGERAALDVGLIGDNRLIPENHQRMQMFGGGDHFLSYLDGFHRPRDLSAVIATARANGLRHVHLYSLDGALRSRAPLPDWLDCAAQPVDWDLEVGPTPVGSLKAGLTGFLLDHLFRTFIRQHPPGLLPDPQS